MRDEDDILNHIKGWEDVKASLIQLQEFTGNPSAMMATVNAELDRLNKELTEYRFTYGDKLHEPKHVEVEEQ